MDKIKYEMEVPKEGKEMVDAVMGLVKHFLDKKPIAEIAGHLPAVMQAVDGYEKIAGEIAGEGRDELAGYLVHKSLELFPAGKKEEAGEQPSVQP